MFRLFITFTVLFISSSSFAQNGKWNKSFKTNSKQKYDVTKIGNTGFIIGTSVLLDGTIQGQVTFKNYGGIGIESGPYITGSIYEDYTDIISMDKALFNYKDKNVGTSYGSATTQAFYLISPSYKNFNFQVGFGTYNQDIYTNFYDDFRILGNNGYYSIRSGSISQSYYTIALAKSVPVFKIDNNPFLSLEGKVLYRKYSDSDWNITSGLGIKLHL